MTKEEILAMEAGIDLDLLITKEFFSDVGYHEYSTDISAAWKVVEKLLTVVNIVDVWGSYIGQEHGGFYCRIRGGITLGLEFTVGPYQGAPEAICKAALLAKLKGGTDGTENGPGIS